MDLIFIAIIFTVMLLLLIAGTVTYCAIAHRDARRAFHNSEVAFDALTRLERDVEEMHGQIIDLRLKAVEKPTESDTDTADAQYERMQAFQPKDYGLTFAGGRQ